MGVCGGPLHSLLWLSRDERLHLGFTCQDVGKIYQLVIFYRVGKKLPLITQIYTGTILGTRLYSAKLRQVSLLPVSRTGLWNGMALAYVCVCWRKETLLLTLYYKFITDADVKVCPL